jgi:hypothetical protein
MLASRCRMKIAFVLISFLLVSCASLTSDAGRSLVGEWRYADDIQSCRYHFKQDGSFTGEVRSHAKLVSKFSGTWLVRGDRLFYTYLSDELGRIPAGATDRDRLLSVQKDAFFIEAADGNRRQYLRVK